MIKYDSSPISLKYDSSPDLVEESNRHLMVLVPMGVDASTAARRLRKLEQATGMTILLLGICREAADEPRIRRDLITIVSLLQDGRQHVELKVESGKDWMEAVRSNYQLGDVIVCFDGQQTGFLQKPLSQLLESNFKADVYVLPGFEPQEVRENTFSQVRAWLGLILIILGFGLLQARIVQVSGNWVQNSLLILSIIPEFWLLRYWAGRPG